MTLLPGSSGLSVESEGGGPSQSSLSPGHAWPTRIERLGLLANGALCWKAATDLWAGSIPGTQWVPLVLMLLGYAAGFAMLVLALLPTAGRWSARAALLAAAIVLLGHVQARMENGVHPCSRPTTDAQLYVDHAARLLRQGENPYAHEMYGAFVACRTDMTLTTGTATGDVSGRLAYPALSFLIHVPLQGLGLAPFWLNACLLVAALALLFGFSRPEVRPLILVPILVSEALIDYVLGGVTDISWTVALLVLIRVWPRPLWAGLVYGLACSLKQQPLLIAPFLFVRLGLEAQPSGFSVHAERSVALRPGPRTARFFGAAASMFLFCNLPFILWNPGAWLAGVTEPLRGAHITFGQGLSALAMTGLAPLRTVSFACLSACALGLSLWVYRRWHRSVGPLIWLAPAIALWFGRRSLASYWTFALFPLLLDLFGSQSTPQQAPPPLSPSPTDPPKQGERTTAIPPPAGPALEHQTAGREADQAPVRPGRDRALGLTLAVIVGLALVVGVGALGSAGWRVEVVAPLRTEDTQVIRLSARVHNGLASAVAPRFFVQTGGAPPAPWLIEQGPERLGPGEQASYNLAAPYPGARFDLSRGTRLTVEDAQGRAPRVGTTVPGSMDHLAPDRIPNGDFRFWTDQWVRPMFWGVVETPAGSGRVTYAVPPAEPGAPAHALRFRVEPSPGPEHRQVLLDTCLVLPETPLWAEVRLPQQANRFPALDLVYGLSLALEKTVVWILFGDEARTGRFNERHIYWMTAAPRERWSSHRLDLRAILRAVGLDPRPMRSRVPRFGDLDLPVVLVNLDLLLAVRHHAEAVEAFFGPLASEPPNSRTLDAKLRLDLAHPETLPQWRGELNLQRRNYAEAMRYFHAAVEADAGSGAAHFGLGEAAFALRQYEAAIRAMQRAVSLGYETGRAQKTIGWAAHAQAKAARAVTAFAAAETALAQRPADAVHLSDARRGLVLSLVMASRCSEVGPVLRRTREGGGSLPVTVHELGPCAGAAGSPEPGRP